MITFPGVIAALAASARTANRPALLGNDPVTFAELHRRGTARVAELADLGVTGGRIVAVVCFNETVVFEYLIAAGALGAALMPLSPALTDTEIVALVDKADAVACVATAGVGAERAQRLSGLSTRRFRLAPAAASGVAGPDPVVPRADSTCWVSTTGGSTGTPRLFAVSHERLLTNSMLNAYEWGWSAYPVHVCLSPIAHGIGFSHAVGQLASGGTVALVERYDPAAAAAWLRGDTRAWTAVVPTMVHDLYRQDASLSALELLVCAGAPLQVGLRERVLEAGTARLVEYYGSTELGWVTWIEHRPGDTREGLVGLPVLGASVRVTGADGRPVPAGEIGRVQKSGRPYAIPLGGGVSAYEANASAWESSGDLGRIDADGALMLAGRVDDMLVIGGQNVYPVEVELVLREHPAVREVVVRGADSDRLGQTMVAYVEATADPRLTAELADLCAARLAGYKRPARFVVLDALPRNSAGKLRRSFGDLR
ncbi:class I adenylate-forming enzyme family protein [Asanoa iriomotensis]|uniref:2-succinylbenzoate-CoA ligase n=1 Tax=Asanoa iriomotensis TaxID=234613 RepID=A0ABQ4BYW5_9ACTN|nr:class I adenylate-forming enzyme family protein [Asanoa iriomotensis]GIF55726.1 2-succinylbenzoate-CoA ligase [Asanoa iriomotensis]